MQYLNIHTSTSVVNQNASSFVIKKNASSKQNGVYAYNPRTTAMFDGARRDLMLKYFPATPFICNPIPSTDFLSYHIIKHGT